MPFVYSKALEKESLIIREQEAKNKWVSASAAYVSYKIFEPGNCCITRVYRNRIFRRQVIKLNNILCTGFLRWLTDGQLFWAQVILNLQSIWAINGAATYAKPVQIHQSVPSTPHYGMCIFIAISRGSRPGARISFVFSEWTCVRIYEGTMVPTFTVWISCIREESTCNQTAAEAN